MTDAPTSGFDPGLDALLDLLRQGEAEPDENARALLRDDLPPPADALLRTIAEHGIYLDLGGSVGGVELTSPRPLDDHGAAERIRAALATKKIGADDAFALGFSGGGEETVLVGWNADGYEVLRWENMEGELNADGSFAEFLVSLRNYLAEDCGCGPEDLEQTDLKTLLEAMGEWDDYWAQ